MTINGPGALNLTVARSAALGTPDFDIFTVDTNGTANITGLTISGGSSDAIGGGIDNSGNLTIASCIVDNNLASESGGGIANSGYLAIANCVIDDNSTTFSSGALLPGGGGSTTMAR